MLLFAVLLPALLIPAVVVGATPSITPSPATVRPGASVLVHGQGFAPKSRGQLTFDGSATGMATYRAGQTGTFDVTVKVPSSATTGSHVLAATSGTVGRKNARAQLIASATLTVDPSAPVVTPTPDPTAAPTTAPTAVPTTAPTATPTKAPTPAPTTAPTPTPTKTASPTPAPTTASDPQPAFPVRAAFYYPWFPEAWNQQGMNPFTRYDPSLGWYDSSASSTIAAQVAAMRYGRISVGIASWWGQGSRTDARIPLLLSATATSSFRWSLYYEAEGQGNPTVAQIQSDLDYILAHYGSQPSFYRINGRPVIFVYGDGTDGCATASRWAQATAGRSVYIVLKVFTGYRTCAAQPDAWHQYSPAVAADSQAGYSFAISPGFFKANESAARLARDPTRWNQDVRDMVASGAPFQLVTTFNEWGEGTAVESASQWASPSGYGTYLDALHNNGQTASATSTPAPTTAPTARPTTAPTSAPTAAPTVTPRPTTTPAPTVQPTPTPPPSSGLPAFKHVYVVLMENEEATGIIGNSSAPYINSLASTYGLATNYTAVAHPSEPNYLALWSGSTQGVTDDGVYNFSSGTTIADQIEASGRSWHVAAENVPVSTCYLGSSASSGEDGTGTYVRKHEPAISWTSVSTNLTRCARITDFTRFDPNAGNFWFIAPNLCHDMHDCSVATGDAFLKGFMPRILTSSAYADGGVVFLTWDEGSTSLGGGGKIVTIVMSPLGKRAFTSSTAHTHYSLLRTVQSSWGLGCLANSCSANTMGEFFN